MPKLVQSSSDLPSYVTETQVKRITSRDIDQASLVPNAVNVMSCASANSQVNIKSGTELCSLVLVKNCKLKFESGVSLEDAVIASTNTDERSINAPSGLRIGRDDACAPGGGAQLLTLGGVDVASDMRLYGAQVVAMKDISSRPTPMASRAPRWCPAPRFPGP